MRLAAAVAAVLFSFPAAADTPAPPRAAPAADAKPLAIVAIKYCGIFMGAVVVYTDGELKPVNRDDSEELEQIASLIPDRSVGTFSPTCIHKAAP